MPTVATIFEVLNGAAAVGRIIGVTTEHAASMRRRNSIPVGYWPAILAEGAKSDPPLVTNQDLIDAHATRRRGRRIEQPAEVHA